MVTENHSLTVRKYEAETDHPLINDWWQARHGALADLPAGLLPPLGCIVEDHLGPCFALWCYEAAGVGVAFIEWPVSRPGMQAVKTITAFEKAMDSLIALAGKCWDPPGDYRVFRANVLPAVYRSIREKGFQREHEHSEGEYIPVILTLNPDES